MTMYDFESCLRARLRWYNDAIALKTGERKWVNGFNFPAGDVEVWRGAAMELKNTLDNVIITPRYRDEFACLCDRIEKEESEMKQNG